MSKQTKILRPKKPRALADAKLTEAKALPPGPEQRKLLKARSYKVLAEAKSWLTRNRPEI
jgi:hypothetical protein